MRALLLVTLAASAITGFAQSNVSGRVPIHVTGRVLGEDREPLASAEVSIAGTGPAARVWQRVDSDGTYDLSIRRSSGSAWQLEVRAPGHVSATHDVWLRTAGRSLELPDTVLQRTCVLLGHLLDADGHLLTEGWRVELETKVQSRAGPPGTQWGTPDPDTGEFRFDDLPAGVYELRASGPYARLAGPAIRLEPGDRHALVLRNPGPPFSRRLLVELDFAPFRPPERVDGGTRLELLGEHGERVGRLRSLSRSGSAWAAEDLAPGDYAVRLVSEDYRASSAIELRPGTLSRLRVQGTAALELTVRDGRRAPLSSYGVELELADDRSRSATVTLAPPGAPAPVDGRFEGLPPGDWRVTVVDSRGLRITQTVSKLGSGQTRRLNLDFPLTADVTGRVTLADGSPAAAARIEITAGRLPGVAGGPQRVQLGDEGLLKLQGIEAATLTDADGRYRFPPLVEGRWTVRVTSGEHLSDITTIRIAAPSASHDVVLPAFGTLVGRVHVPEPAQLGRVELTVGPAEAGDLAQALLALDGKGRVHLESSGRFRVEELPTGRQMLRSSLTSPHLAVVHALSRSGRVIASTGATTSPGPSLLVDVDATHVADVELDLRAAFKASLYLELQDREGPRTDLRLQPLRPFEHPGGTAWTATGVAGPVLRPGASSAGFAYEGLAPGRLRLDVQDALGRWAWRPAVELELRSGELCEHVVRVPLDRARLVLLDPAGHPVVDARVALESEDLTFGGSPYSTDEQGALDLELPGPTRLRIAVRAGDEAWEAAVAWPPASSPQEVRLEARR